MPRNSAKRLASQRLSPAVLSYILLGGLAMAASVFHLAPAILTGLTIYVVLESVRKALEGRLKPFLARYLSLFVLLVALVLAGAMVVKLVRQGVAAVPDIMEKLNPSLSAFSAKYDLDFQWDSVDELKSHGMNVLKENWGNVTRSGRVILKEAFKILLGAFIAVFFFLEAKPRENAANLYDTLGAELARQVRSFMGSFRLVLGAQVLITSVNTVFTAVFLLSLGFPYVVFLVLTTFFSGLIPIVGNLISNTVIVGAALTITPEHALFSLVFLVAIHKLEYFLNGRIVGSNVQLPMWLMMIGILLGEVFFGLAGIPLAPAVLHFIRNEMRTMRA